MEPKSSNKKTIGISVAVVVVIVLVLIFLEKQNPAPVAVQPSTDTTSSQQSTPVNTTPVTTSTTVDTTKDSVSANTYKDGTYTAIGSYMSPGGPDKISVTLTVKNDVVTVASVTPMPGDNESSRYQGIFASNYQSQVVGQNLSSLNLTKVSRSSLTPKGFDDALDQIRTQAKA